MWSDVVSQPSKHMNNTSVAQVEDIKDRWHTSICMLELKLCCETVFIDNILTKHAPLRKQFYIGNRCVKCK